MNRKTDTKGQGKTDDIEDYDQREQSEEYNDEQDKQIMKSKYKIDYD